MKIRVKEPGSIEYNGDLYLPGLILDVPKEEAERLIGKGKAEPIKNEAKPDPEPEKAKEKK